MGRKSKLSIEQIAESSKMIDNKEISLRKRAKNLDISHPQLRDSIIKYKKMLKENNQANTMRDKKIDEISKDMDQELYKDHIEKDQKPDQEIDQETYDKVVGSLRNQFNVPEKPKKPHKQRNNGGGVYISLDVCRGLYGLIFNKGASRKTNLTRDQFLEMFSKLFQDQKNIKR